MIRTVLFIAIAVLSACAQQPAAQSTRGAQLYQQHCAACHGMTGQGDGPVAADLGVAPANLTDLSRRNGGVFPTEDVMAQIYGYHGRYLSGGMPEFGPLLVGPLVDFKTEDGKVVPTPRALIDLAQYLQSIQQ